MSCCGFSFKVKFGLPTKSEIIAMFKNIKAMMSSSSDEQCIGTFNGEQMYRKTVLLPTLSSTTVDVASVIATTSFKNIYLCRSSYLASNIHRIGHAIYVDIPNHLAQFPASVLAHPTNVYLTLEYTKN